MSVPGATVFGMADTPSWNRTGAAAPAGAPTGQQWPAPPPVAPPALTVGRRTFADITRLLDNIELAVREGYELPEFFDGVRDAYRWVSGRAAAPYTGRTGIPDAQQLREEDDAADEAMRTGPRRTHANGVQHAVMWVRGATEDQPWLIWQSS